MSEITAGHWPCASADDTPWVSHHDRAALLEAGVGGEVLRERSLSSVPWLGAGPHQVLQAAADEVDWPGVILGCVEMADGLVAPVVMARPHAWSVRLGQGAGPIVDRAWWRDCAGDGYAAAPLHVIDVVGFVVVAHSLAKARSTCARLLPMAPVAALVPATVADPRTQDRQVELMRCDYLGIGVLAASGAQVAPVIAPGRWRPPRGPVHYQQRLRSEQLFELALRSGYWPEER